MLKSIANERGSSLVLVLLIMLVFTVMGLGLLGTTLTSAKQVNHTNGSIQSTNLSEMGIDHVKSTVVQTIAPQPSATLEQTLASIRTALHDDTVIVDDANHASFTISDLAVKGTRLVDKSGKVTGERLNVTFTSTGVAGGTTPKSIATTLELTRAGTTEQLYTKTDNVRVFAVTESAKYTRTFVEKFVHYQENLELYAPSALTFNHNLIVEGTTTLEANSDILVKGDAHFKGKLDVKTNKPGNGNLGNVCVEGTLYYYGNPSDNAVNTNFATCDSVSKQNGVFAKKVVYLAAKSAMHLRWDTDLMDIQTVY